MVFRFRRTARSAPGLRLNLGKRGMSLSTGLPGASVTFGRRGVYGNVGLSGSGISYRRRIDKGKDRGGSAGASGLPHGAIDLEMHLEEDGSVRFTDKQGNEAAPRYVRLLREQKGELLKAWLEEKAAEQNQPYDACVNLHLETPAPTMRVLREMPKFQEGKPTAPAYARIGFFDRVFGRRAGIEAANAERRVRWEQDCIAWEARKAAYEAEAVEWAETLSRGVQGDRDAMERMLGAALAGIEWPRETEVAFDFGDDAATLDLDIDLPGVEDVPRRIASVAARGLRLSFKERTDAQSRRDYARVVHASTMRVIGEAFSALPTLRRVTVSGFAQRNDPATGQKIGDYLLSVQVDRVKWEKIDFVHLDLVDPIVALERFDLIRKLDRGARFQTIEPHAGNLAK